MVTKCGFSINHYKECMLDIATDKQYSTRQYELLHDLDHPEDNILMLAEIEAKQGLSAKYFVRLHAKYYNALSYTNLQTYRELIKMGHEVGLHFEPSFYPDKNNLTTAIHTEEAFLSAMIESPINCVSIHEPARYGSVSEKIIPAHLKYYCWDSSYYQGKKYISDSSARWREGCMCQHIGKHDSTIILTHPIWWSNEFSAENY